MIGIRMALEGMRGKAEVVGEVLYELMERTLGIHALRLKETGAGTLIGFRLTISRIALRTFLPVAEILYIRNVPCVRISL